MPAQLDGDDGFREVNDYLWRLSDAQLWAMLLEIIGHKNALATAKKLMGNKKNYTEMPLIFLEYLLSEKEIDEDTFVFLRIIKEILYRIQAQKHNIEISNQNTVDINW